MLRATSERVTPGGRGPWTGRSSNVSATFVCGAALVGGAAAAASGARRIRRAARRVVGRGASLTRGGATISDPRRSEPEARADFHAAAWYRFHGLREQGRAHDVAVARRVEAVQDVAGQGIDLDAVALLVGPAPDVRRAFAIAEAHGDHLWPTRTARARPPETEVPGHPQSRVDGP